MSNIQVQEPTIEEVFRRAFGSLPIGIALCTAGDCLLASTILYVNQAFCTLSGYSEDVLVEHSALLLGGARPDAKSVRRLSSTGAEADLHATVTKFRPDGTTYRAQSAILPICGAQGEVSHFLALEYELSTAHAARVAMTITRDDALASLAAVVTAIVAQSVESIAARHQEALSSLQAAERPAAKLEAVLCDALANAGQALEAVHRLGVAHASFSRPPAFRVHGALTLLVEFTRRDLRTEAEMKRIHAFVAGHLDAVGEPSAACRNFVPGSASPRRPSPVVGAPPSDPQRRSRDVSSSAGQCLRARNELLANRTRLGHGLAGVEDVPAELFPELSLRRVRSTGAQGVCTAASPAEVDNEVARADLELGLGRWLEPADPRVVAETGRCAALLVRESTPPDLEHNAESEPASGTGSPHGPASDAPAVLNTPAGAE